ncbi:NAD(+) synthase [Treponema sp. R6D11]
MSFDAKTEHRRIVDFIRELFGESTLKAIVGISGGKDSAIVAGLCIEALGKDRVRGILLPNGEQKDIDDSLEIVNHLDIKYQTVNIAPIFEAYLAQFKSEEIGDSIVTNLPAGIRMNIEANIVSKLENGLIANTCNLSEEWIGYATKFGDSYGDFSPLADYTVTEVRAIGKECAPIKDLERIIYKTPHDGMCGKSDEEKVGFTYDVLDRYIRDGICEDEKIREKIDTLHKKNLHKILPMPKCEYLKIFH